MSAMPKVSKENTAFTMSMMALCFSGSVWSVGDWWVSLICAVAAVAFGWFALKSVRRHVDK